jgi:hypothetical protein
MGIAMSIGVSFAEAANAKVGFVGYVLAIIVGLGVGLASIWTTVSIAKRSPWGKCNSQKHVERKIPEWQSIAILIGAIFASGAWIVLNGFLGGLASYTALRLVR